MAFYCERETVLRAFHDHIDIYYQQSKYELGDTLRASSPKQASKMPHSRSLEQYTSLLKEGSTVAGNTSQKSANRLSVSGANQCTVVSFDDSKQNVSTSSFP